MGNDHVPVLLNECIDGLNVNPKGTYVDATYGDGGYSEILLKKLSCGKLFAIDMDEAASADLPENQNFFFIHGNFKFIKNYLKYYRIEQVDGIVADLGVSSRHFDQAERGFTYRTEALLDMRMNTKSTITAEKVINEYDVNQLSGLLKEYGELKQADKLANLIAEKRKEEKIETNMQLIGCIQKIVPKRTENQFLSQVFQALRIEVNQELENLRIFLHSSVELLRSGGRLVVVSYHSLEDRMVKNFMKWGKIDGPPEKDLYGKWSSHFNVITKKPLIPGEEEIMKNPRSRSARLRIAIKI
ncbi:MAG: 16S rRNA (cytosine(1402)-N(4))-methyltransferase RsmH [Bacteroidales bacterium]|nr:16S rRNA (cytosine(1402)-N(4))-methyltransferase RsmH [Bacteroidales bacterium]